MYITVAVAKGGSILVFQTVSPTRKAVVADRHNPITYVKDYENYLGKQNYLKRIGSDATTNVKSCTSTEFREFKSRFYDEIPKAGYCSTYGDQKLLLETGIYPER